MYIIVMHLIEENFLEGTVNLISSDPKCKEGMSE